MLARIEILCFAASYTVALLAELARLVRPEQRPDWARRIAIGFGGAGLVAQTLYLAHRGQSAVTPLSSAFDWYLVAAWSLVAIYLYLAIAHPRYPIGLFVLPLVLGLIGVATFLADRQPFPSTQASQVWGAIHGGFLAAGTVAVMVGFVAGMMYLAQAYRLKRKLPPPRSFELPSLEWLGRTNGRAMVIAVLTLGIGVVSGVILNLVNHGKQVDQLPWTDPVVLSSTATVVWLTVATLFLVVYRPARQARKVAYLTLASFAFLLMALAIALLVDTQHGRTVGRASLSRLARPLTVRPHTRPSPRSTGANVLTISRRGVR
jgi:ABC-type uncharacterized transport system permease subunit